MPLSQPSPTLFTDLYELTMAQAYWQHRRTAEATFSLFFRAYPPNRGYLVYAGLADVLEHLEALRFTDEDVRYLRSIGRFDDAFLDWLPSLRFTGNVRSMAEGEIVFVNEPVIEITAPIIEAQLVETYVINQINLQTTLATKASRVVHAAAGRGVVDFAPRRTHGTDAANKLARVCYMTGCAATSNVYAAARYAIPPAGTMAHSFIQSFPSELEAFRAYAASFPETSTLLVDTYDTIQGVKHAIQVGHELREQGHRLQAIRIDSGDFLSLAREARRLLNDAGLSDVRIIASGGLDEFEVDELVRAGAPYDTFGVGTRLGVSADAPWTDCAYKLVEYDGQPVLKLSPGKITLPGRKQVYRLSDADGQYDHDVIALTDEPVVTPGPAPLLHSVMERGQRMEPAPSLATLREQFAARFAKLPLPYKAIQSPERYPVAESAPLQALRQQVTQRVIEKELGE